MDVIEIFEFIIDATARGGVALCQLSVDARVNVGKYFHNNSWVNGGLTCIYL